MTPTIPFLDLDGTTAAVRDGVLTAWSGLLSANRYIGGAAVEDFEQAWAEYCGTPFAIGVANGTDALQVTLRALNIGAGDDVIVPANSFVATAEAVALTGAAPRFADVDPTTLLLTPDQLAAAITPRTRAVIVVHLYGQVADMPALAKVAEQHGVLLIEDAAQAHGATWLDRRAGSFGIAGCFSFYPGKNLGAFGDGGAIVTSDEDLARRLISLRDHGRANGSHYDHTLLGTNSRLDALQAAVLGAKLAFLDEWNRARRAIVGRYRIALADAGLRFVDEVPQARSCFHLCVIRVPRRERVRRMFESLGVQTGVHYPIPIHQLAPYAHLATRPMPIAEKAAAEVVSLPLFPHMTGWQVDEVCAAITVVGDLLAAERDINA